MNNLANYPNASILIESMRSIGYTFETALCDIIDNSIYAKAKNITFVENISNEFILNNCEESGQAFQLAIQIKEKIKNIRKFKFYLLTDGIISKNLRTLEDKKNERLILEYNVWDIQRIYDLALAGMQKEEIKINIHEFGFEGLECIFAVSSKNENYDSYLAVINGRLLADLYINYGARLLEGNVRSFLSTRGKINKEIRNTILNKPEIFFAYNNGIAATATEIKTVIKNDKKFITEIVDFQIINGGQTTASIANTVIQDKADVSKVMIPVKLSVVDREKAEEMIPNIARYANSQNKVDESDFFSNSPFHRRFEDFSRRILAPAVNGNQFSTAWFYERARGQYVQEQMKCTPAQKKQFEAKNPKRQVIKKTDLAKYIMSFMRCPHLVSKGNQYNMSSFASFIEKQWKLNDIEFNEFFYKKSIALAIMFRTVETMVSGEEWYKQIKAYRANIVTYSIARIFEFIEEEHSGKTIDFIRIWNNQSLYDSLIEQFKILSFEIFEFITKGEKETINITEWCKKENCWLKCKKTKFTFNEDFVESLIDVKIEVQSANEGRKNQKENNRINNMTTVVELGEDYWANVLIWGDNNKMLNETYLSLLSLASNMERKKLLPSDKQCEILLRIKNEFEENGMKKI